MKMLLSMTLALVCAGSALAGHYGRQQIILPVIAAPVVQQQVYTQAIVQPQLIQQQAVQPFYVQPQVIQTQAFVQPVLAQSYGVQAQVFTQRVKRVRTAAFVQGGYGTASFSAAVVLPQRPVRERIVIRRR